MGDPRTALRDALGRMAQTLHERWEQFHTLRLGESLDPFNPAVQSFLEQAQARFLQQTGDPWGAFRLRTHLMAVRTSELRKVGHPMPQDN